MNTAVIFAGGVGRRMNSGSLPKQFLKVDGKEIIVHTLDEGVKEQYPEMREKFAAALSAARLSMDESAKPYLDEMGIAPGENWMEAEFGLMEKATMDGFDAILNQ